MKRKSVDSNIEITDALKHIILLGYLSKAAVVLFIIKRTKLYNIREIKYKDENYNGIQVILYVWRSFRIESFRWYYD